MAGESCAAESPLPAPQGQMPPAGSAPGATLHGSADVDGALPQRAPAGNGPGA